MRVVDNMNKMEDSYSHDKENAIIVDMDSTLCFNTTKRPFWGDGAAEGMLTDIPNRPVCDLVQIMHMQNFKVLIVTGREGSPDIIEATKSWLKIMIFPMMIYSLDRIKIIARVLQLKKESIRKRSNLIIMYGLY